NNLSKLLDCSDRDFILFISALLEYDPSKRLNPLQGLFHPFLSELIPLPLIFHGPNGSDALATFPVSAGFHQRTASSPYAANIPTQHGEFTPFHYVTKGKAASAFSSASPLPLDFLVPQPSRALSRPPTGQVSTANGDSRF